MDSPFPRLELIAVSVRPVIPRKKHFVRYAKTRDMFSVGPEADRQTGHKGGAQWGHLSMVGPLDLFSRQVGDHLYHEVVVGDAAVDTKVSTNQMLC